jgi:SAM-dependent methyltransferase
VKPQQWDSALYDDRHSFVWQSGASLIELLKPEPGERILDLGCGTGHLTAKIAETGAIVVGMDSSPSMIAQARQNFPSQRFVLADASDFRFEEIFDAVFSNAALHWIHDAEAVVKCVAAALRAGGRFVLEMGARGNIETIRQAIETTLTEAGHAPRSPGSFRAPASMQRSWRSTVSKSGSRRRSSAGQSSNTPSGAFRSGWKCSLDLISRAFRPPNALLSSALSKTGCAQAYIRTGRGGPIIVAFASPR